MEKKIKDVPILLLDDVLSELDAGRQNYLLDSIRNVQTMITCTGWMILSIKDLKSINCLKWWRGQLPPETTSGKPVSIAGKQEEMHEHRD